jgi:Flp pilus assembly protein TadG
MGYKKMMRRLRSSKGGVLVEVAIVSFFLLVLVVGIGTVHVEINEIES